MNQKVAEKLVRFIATHMARESALMYPDPQVYMVDPYALLHLIRQESGATEEMIDTWMVEAQRESKKKGST